MPSFNQTGPNGQGPMTGRRMGRCTNFGANLKNQSAIIVNENPGENNTENSQGLGFGYGKGLSRGRGRGMGRQNRFRGGF
ncbi:MAG TPA: DUF5320 domain-containing protein [Bacteroidales bacterium]|nr:DUF5320 domain-containing protein [Bacteroidales bacterium]